MGFINTNIQKTFKIAILWVVSLISAHFILKYFGFDKTIIYMVLEIISVLYGIYLSFITIDYIVELKFKGRKGISSTKSTISIIFKFIVIVIGIALFIDTIGYYSKINNTALFAILGISLGLTSNIWFPDVFSGLTMIFTKYINEEDIIEIKEKNIFGVIHRIGLFFTVIRNIRNDHFIIIRNSKVKDSVIDNFTKVTNPQGLKESLEFKIGYKDIDNNSLSIKDVYSFFDKAFDKCKSEISDINYETGIQKYLKNTGDHALEFIVFFYIKKEKVKNREIVKWKMTEIFYKESLENNIDLSTPLTIEIKN